MKKHEKYAEQLINSLPKDLTLYTKRHKGYLLIVQKENKQLIDLKLDFGQVFDTKR